MFNKFLTNNLVLFTFIIVFFIFILYSYFFASVIRTVEEDELIKKGFDAKAYVENIWISNRQVMRGEEFITFSVTPFIYYPENNT